MDNFTVSQIVNLKKIMINDLDKYAKRELSPIIRKIKNVDDAINVCLRMGMSKNDANQYINRRIGKV